MIFTRVMVMIIVMITIILFKVTYIFLYAILQSIQILILRPVEYLPEYCLEPDDVNREVVVDPDIVIITKMIMIKAVIMIMIPDRF